MTLMGLGFFFDILILIQWEMIPSFLFINVTEYIELQSDIENICVCQRLVWEFDRDCIRVRLRAS